MREAEYRVYENFRRRRNGNFRKRKRCNFTDGLSETGKNKMVKNKGKIISLKLIERLIEKKRRKMEKNDKKK